MKNYVSTSSHVLSHSRNPSPLYVSSPLTSRENPRITPLIHTKSPIVIRSSSVSPFKRIAGINVEKNLNNEVNVWKNKYESLLMIYQMEIEELRKFYSTQTQNQTIQPNNEEINQIKKDNRILSEFIKKNQEEIDVLVHENHDLKKKITEISITVEKVGDLIEKNLELNSLADRKTEELTELMLKNADIQETLYSKNEELEHLKGLVAQLIQDNDRLSEVLEPLKKENSELSHELDMVKQQIEEKYGQKEALEREIQDLRYLNEELNAQLSLRLKEESTKQETDVVGNFNNNNNNNNESTEYIQEVLIENFKELKEENFKLKQEMQGYYGDILLMREREKMLRKELDKNKKGFDSGKGKSKESPGLFIK